MKLTDLTLVLGLGLGLSSASGAWADVSLTQTTTIDSPQLSAQWQKQTPAERERTVRSGFAPSQITTLLVGMNIIRVEAAGGFTQADMSARTLTYGDPAAHEFHTQTYDPQIMQDTANRVTGTLTDTGQQKMILGQTAKHYRISLTSVGWGVTATGDIWLASDLAQPPLPSLLGGSLGTVAGMLAKLPDPRAHHLPLLMNVRLSGGPSGQMTMKTQVTALTTAALSPAAFTVPKGITGHR